MRYTQRDVPALIAARKAFDIGNMSATTHYPHGIGFTPSKGQNNVMWPVTRALYIVYSYSTPIAWIDQYGRAKRTPQHFSVTTSKHMSRVWSMKDDAKITGKKADRERQDKIDTMRYNDYLQARAEVRAEQQRHAQQRRYWTPERLAAKELREQAREVAKLYGIKVTDATRALTRAPDEFSTEDAIASLTGTRPTRDAEDSPGSLTHA